MYISKQYENQIQITMNERNSEEQVMDLKLLKIRQDELKKYGVDMSMEEIDCFSFEIYQSVLEIAKEQWQVQNSPLDGVIDEEGAAKKGVIINKANPSADDLFQGRCDTLMAAGFVRDFDTYTLGDKAVTTMQIRALSDKNFAALFENKPESTLVPIQTDAEHDKQAFEIYIQCINQVNLPAVKMQLSKDMVGRIVLMRDKMIADIQEKMSLKKEK